LNATAARLKSRRLKTDPKKVKLSLNGKKPIVIKASPRTLAGLARVFKQLADESRLKILMALSQEGELHVSALCQLLNQTQPGVSHHLTLLRMSGLVGFRRQGKNNYYRLEAGLVADVLEQLFAESGNNHRKFQFDEFAIVYKRR
jgi:ArsR family transcriptional regulator